MKIFGSSKKEKSDINFLELTPIRNYEHEVREDGLIDILVPKFTSKFGKKFINKKLRYPHIKANLDELGSSTWLLIDGNKKVEEIASELSEKHEDKINPVDDRLIQFLNDLYRNGFIYFKEIRKGN